MKNKKKNKLGGNGSALGSISPVLSPISPILKNRRRSLKKSSPISPLNLNRFRSNSRGSRGSRGFNSDSDMDSDRGSSQYYSKSTSKSGLGSGGISPGVGTQQVPPSIEKEEDPEKDFEMDSDDEEFFSWDSTNEYDFLLKYKVFEFLFHHSLHKWISYFIFSFVLGFCCLSVGPFLWVPISSTNECGWCTIVNPESIIGLMIMVSSLFHYTVRRDLYPVFIASGILFHTIWLNSPFVGPYSISPFGAAITTVGCFIVLLLKRNRVNRDGRLESLLGIFRIDYFQSNSLNIIAERFFLFNSVLGIFLSALVLIIYLKFQPVSFTETWDLMTGLLTGRNPTNYHTHNVVNFICIIMLASLSLIYHCDVKKPYTLLTLSATIPQIAVTLYLLEETHIEMDPSKPFAGGLFYILNILTYLSFYCGLAIDVILASIERHDKIKAKDEHYHRRLSTQINEQNDFVKQFYADKTAQILEKVDFMQKFVEKILSSTEDIAKKSRDLESNELNTWQLQQLTSIQNQSNQSLFLLNDIKIILAIESGLVSREDISFNLFEFLNVILDKSSKDIKSGDVELVYRFDKSVPFNLIFDPGALIQICFQLLSNSIKYTEKGEIGILIRKIENLNSSSDSSQYNTNQTDYDNELVLLEFTIFDTGIGMSNEELDICNQFLPFPPLSSNEKKKGSGLGLVICNKIAKSIGGELFAERNPDGPGTSFSLRVAMQVDNNPNLLAIPYPLSNDQKELFQNLPILLIDDNPHNRYTVKYILSLLGAKASTVASSVEGIRELKLAITISNPFKLLLIDYHMPGCDGLETIQMIRDNPLFIDVKIILLLSPSDKILNNEKTKSISFITKPLTHLNLINGISQAFNISAIKKTASISDIESTTSDITNNLSANSFDSGNTPLSPISTSSGPPLTTTSTNNTNFISNSMRKDMIRFNSEFPLKVHDSGKPIMRVLIGTVDNTAQSEIQSTLEGFGYFSTFVSDGVSMISLLKKNFYDLVIVDLDLPIVNGFDVSEFIRNQEDYTHNALFLPNPTKDSKSLKRRLSLSSFPTNSSCGGSGGNSPSGSGSSSPNNPNASGRNTDGSSNSSPTIRNGESINHHIQPLPAQGDLIQHRRRVRLPILAISKLIDLSDDQKQRARDIGIDTFCSITNISVFLKPFLIKIEKRRKQNILMPIRVLESTKRQIDILDNNNNTIGTSNGNGSQNTSTTNLLALSNSIGSSGSIQNPLSGSSNSPSLNVSTTQLNNPSGTNILSNISEQSPSINPQVNSSSSNSPLSMVGSNGPPMSTKLVGIKPNQIRKIQDLENIISLFVPVEFQQLIAPTGMENVYLGDAISKTITIFFSDIREFTSTTEKMIVDDVIDFLNTYLAFAIPAITERGGFIDKFIGDAIMAIFPQSDLNEQAIFAVKAAVGMMRALDFMHVSGFRFSTVETGIGINTGKTIIGIVGTETRMEPTALGDAVNLASRTEQLCKDYGCRILITQFTLQAIGASIDEFTVRYVDSVTVKGKSEVVDIYEVIDGEKEAKRALKTKILPIYSNAIEQFRLANYEQALSYLQECNDILPNDKPTMIHIDKCLKKIKEENLNCQN